MRPAERRAEAVQADEDQGPNHAEAAPTSPRTDPQLAPAAHQPEPEAEGITVRRPGFSGPDACAAAC